MSIIKAFAWALEYWWIVAPLLALLLGAGLWSGIVSIAKIVGAVLKLAAAIAGFFADPRKQIAAKIVYGGAVALVAAALAYNLGAAEERATWEARMAEAARAIEKAQTERDTRIDAKLHGEVTETLNRIKAKHDELQSKVSEYERCRRNPGTEGCPPIPSDAACLLTDDDLRQLQLVPEGRAPGNDKPRFNLRQRLLRMPAPGAARRAP